MHTYLDQLQYVLNHGVKKGDRTGVGTISCFGLHARYAMADGFPAVTTKWLVWKSILSELLWFISGSDNIRDLKTYLKSNRLWDGNYEDYLNRLGIDKNDGSMGRIYGVQWRRWKGANGKVVDQLQEAINLIRENPESRRIMVDAWNAAEIGSLRRGTAPVSQLLPILRGRRQIILTNVSAILRHVFRRTTQHRVLFRIVAHGRKNYGPHPPRIYPCPRRRTHLLKPPRRSKKTTISQAISPAQIAD